MADYTLYYWPFLPGRGEYIRLMFEAAGVGYDDIARRPESEGGGIAAIHRILAYDKGLRPLAVPAVMHEGRVLAQVANILHSLSPALGMAPADPADRAEALQLQLTVADWIAEAHDTHHPLGKSQYYEDQIEAATHAAQGFRQHRLPKFAAYFETALGERTWFLGDAVSYVDLSVAHTLDGLEYAFPTAFAALKVQIPRLLAHRDRCWTLPALAAYRASDRRMAFNEDGIFRRYPALDGGLGAESA